MKNFIIETKYWIIIIFWTLLGVASCWIELELLIVPISLSLTLALMLHIVLVYNKEAIKSRGFHKIAKTQIKDTVSYDVKETAIRLIVRIIIKRLAGRFVARLLFFRVITIIEIVDLWVSVLLTIFFTITMGRDIIKELKQLDVRNLSKEEAKDDTSVSYSTIQQDQNFSG